MGICSHSQLLWGLMIEFLRRAAVRLTGSLTLIRPVDLNGMRGDRRGRIWEPA